MQIDNDHVVTLSYKLTNQEGDVLDQSSEDQPLQYLHGHKNIIPGLEEALTEKSQGEEVNVDIPADKAYGQHDPNMIQDVPRTQFEGVDSIEEGMRFQAQTSQGPIPVVVKGVGEENVTLDANHPLAGQDLHFDVKIEEVRPATQEELDHGHVH